jgi:hypothetical protein
MRVTRRRWESKRELSASERRSVPVTRNDRAEIHDEICCTNLASHNGHLTDVGNPNRPPGVLSCNLEPAPAVVASNPVSLSKASLESSRLGDARRQRRILPVDQHRSESVNCRVELPNCLIRRIGSRLPNALLFTGNRSLITGVHVSRSHNGSRRTQSNRHASD